jgi:ribosomal protein S12
MRAKKDFQFKAEHKNPNGGLNAKGRAAYNRATGSNLKAPQPEGGPRKKSFCARSAGQMKMWPEAAKDPNSRLRKARRAWDC